MAILEGAFGRVAAVREAVVREVKRPPITTDVIHSSILYLFGLYEQARVQYEETFTRYGVTCRRTDQELILSLRDIQLIVGYDEEQIPSALSVLPRCEKHLLPKDVTMEGVSLPLAGGVYRVVNGFMIVDYDKERTLQELAHVLERQKNLLERFLPTPGVG